MKMLLERKSILARDLALLDFWDVTLCQADPAPSSPIWVLQACSLLGLECDGTLSSRPSSEDLYSTNASQ